MNFDYIKHHILLLVVVALLIFGAVYGIESLIASHDAANATKYAQILQEQEKQTAVLEARLEQQESQWQQQNQTQLALIQKLGASITQRNAQLTQTKQQNSTLSAEEAANTLVKLTGDNQIKAVDSTVVLDLPAAISTVNTFDSLATLQANYSDVQQQLESERLIADNLQSDVDKQKDVIAAKDAQIAAQAKKYDGDVASLKAEARKSKLKWALFGAIGAGIARALLGI